MASIPLPALHVDTQQQSPLALYAQAQQIRNAQTQQQIEQADLQQRQISLQQTQALNRSYAEAIKPDENGVPQIDTPTLTKSLAASNAGAAIPGAIESVTKYNKSLIDLKTASTDLQSKQADLKSKSADLVGHAAQAVKQANYDPRLAHTLLDGLGANDPTFRAKIDDPVQLKQLVDSAIAASPEQQKMQNEQEVARIRANTPENQEMQSWIQQNPGKTPADYVTFKASQAPEQKEMADYIAKNPGKGPADFAKWKASLAPAAANAAQGGVTAWPADDPQVAAVANNKMKIQDVLTPRTPLPLRRGFLNEVLKQNPDFRSSDYDIEKGVMKSATSGTIATNLTNFNTAIEHAKQLQEDANALDNTNLQTYNKIGNRLNVELGKDAVTNFNVVKNALAGEMSKVFKGGQATDAEIKAVEQPFSDANSPQQLKGAIASALRLMNSKRDALKQQVDQGMQGKPNFGNTGGGSKVLSPAEWLAQQKKGATP